VEVTVAVEPNVEIKDAFGTVVIVQGEASKAFTTKHFFLINANFIHFLSD